MTTTQEVNRLDVTLTNHGLDAVLRELMDENEEGRYDLYNGTYGNRIICSIQKPFQAGVVILAMRFRQKP